MYGAAIAGLKLRDNVSEAEVFATFIMRFVKIQLAANPYDLADDKYFANRLKEKKNAALKSRQNCIFLPLKETKVS